MVENVDVVMGRQADVRIMTLKRWDFPQTARLFPETGEGLVADENYISYNTHHFIHIEECSNEKEPPIRRAHYSLESLRKQQRKKQYTKQCNTEMAGIHTVQSITLLGEKGTFWDEPGDVLYISFLQLTNTATVALKEIQRNINSIIKRRAPGASWALYQSLDFCDFVLFTKDLSYEDCNRIMWDLAIFRSEKLAILRDTFTIYGFRQEFLKDAFLKLDQGKCPQWKDRASLSIQLSIQSYDVWKKFEGKLKEDHIRYHALRTSGRYDVRLVMNDLPGEQILRLMYLLDHMAEESADRAFGGYEISLESPLDDTRVRNPADAYQDRDLEQAMIGVLDVLCVLCADAGPESADYVDETQRSLKGLLKNGFSEEFVLSVLSTLLAFLQITIEIREYRDRMELKGDEEYLLKQSQEKMTRHYFNALNILALCTMHSERQFVQAPAFNATYFDVPPKLLAFYSAVAQEVLDALRGESEPYYQFLFIPNYQRDINVRPLELEMRENLSQHLAVVHLHESYFYDPVLTIKLFCHEAAHYLSNRHRKERALYIFRVISFLLLANTPLGDGMKETKNNSVLAVMADSLADFLLEKIEEQTPHFTRDIPYHLGDISAFLSSNAYGIDFFRDSVEAECICNRWKRALLEKEKFEFEKFHGILRTSLEYIQTTLRSDYLVKVFEQYPNAEYVYEVFSRNIAYCASFPDMRTPDVEFNNFCENIIQVFSEAYADLRMSELMGEEFMWCDYVDMFSSVDVDNDYQKILRHDSVLAVMAANADWTHMVSAEDENGDSLLFSYVVEQIRQYLELCHKEPYHADLVVQVLRDFKGSDVSVQCARIREVIQKYRKYLTQYCWSILAKYSQL